MYTWVRNSGKEFLQRFYLNGRFLWRLQSAGADAAITFDDGPHPQYTPEILALLSKLGVKATFFLIGRNAENYPEIVRSIVAEGHSIGGHSFDHEVITGKTTEELAKDLDGCRKSLMRITGIESWLFRPPKGKVNIRSILCVCNLGYKLVHWSKTSSDYKCDGADLLVKRLRELNFTHRDILLFHDNNPFTTQALQIMLPEWLSAGVVFRAIEQK